MRGRQDSHGHGSPQLISVGSNLEEVRHRWAADSIVASRSTLPKGSRELLGPSLVYASTRSKEMKNFIEDNEEDQFANGQSCRDLLANSGAAEPRTQLDAVNVIERCPKCDPRRVFRFRKLGARAATVRVPVPARADRCRRAIDRILA
jgi:hypothetical protein